MAKTICEAMVETIAEFSLGVGRETTLKAGDEGAGLGEGALRAVPSDVATGGAKDTLNVGPRDGLTVDQLVK
ncbi:MAG: hypothetical protein WD871_10030 [Xanthobacteraceae bacterium]